MSRYEEPDALEAPPEGYEPSLRVQMALEARLKACPVCAAPLYTVESSRFHNDEGAGGTVKTRFLCEAACTVMVHPSGRVKAYAIEPCREAMRAGVERLAAEAAVFGEPPRFELGQW